MPDPTPSFLFMRLGLGHEISVYIAPQIYICQLRCQCKYEDRNFTLSIDIVVHVHQENGYYCDYTDYKSVFAVMIVY